MWVCPFAPEPTLFPEPDIPRVVRGPGFLNSPQLSCPCLLRRDRDGDWEGQGASPPGTRPTLSDPPPFLEASSTCAEGSKWSWRKLSSDAQEVGVPCATAAELCGEKKLNLVADPRAVSFLLEKGLCG